MTPWVLRLLVANTLVYFLTLPLVPGLFAQFGWVSALGLERPWTILTYQFIHANLMHLLLNMIVLFFFGPRIEARIGSRHFLGLYLIAGSMGAVLSSLGAAVGLMHPMVPIVGASGAVFGVLLGFARYWPEERIYIWGVLPVKARVLVIALALFSIWAGLGGAGGSVAHLAHLGGFVGGWGYLKILERRSPARQFRKQVEQAGLPRASGRDLARWEAVERSGLHPINRDEFDRVLDKARSHGVAALTPQERAFMERFTQG